ncbi:MAG: hypothetical protein WBC91_15870 [Phototrophicaceae bacterium]
MQDKTQRRSVIDPVLLLLKSRRVLIALVSLGVSLIVMLVPQLAAFHSELLILVMTLALALIGGLSLEDAVIAARQTTNDADLRALIDATVDAIMDTILQVDETGWDSRNIEDTRPNHTPN